MIVLPSQQAWRGTMSFKPKLILMVGGMSLLSACGGGDSSSTDNTSSFRLDSGNSQQVLQAIVAQFDSMIGSVGYRLESGAAANPNAPGLFSIIKQHRDANRLAQRIDLAATDSRDCIDGGTYSETTNIVNNPPEYSETGSEIYTQCNEFGIIVNGSVSYSYQENSNTLDYSDQTSGSLTMTIPASPPSTTEDVVIGFSNLQYMETGNDGTFTYTTSQMSFTMTFSAPSFNFSVAVGLGAPIVESNGDDCPESGAIVISDSFGNTATGTFNGSTVEVTHNGSSVGSFVCS
jgi:hypothetical protein